MVFLVKDFEFFSSNPYINLNLQEQKKHIDSQIQILSLKCTNRWRKQDNQFQSNHFS